MQRIRLVDLKAQHEPLAGALRAAVDRVLASSRFILGAEVAAFEAELAAALGFAAAVATSSGTDALLALLMAAGVGPGDEVITSPYSFFASVEGVMRLGARPVFADIQADTFNLDPEAALERLTPRTKAVLPVHLFGRAARLAPLNAACTGTGIRLLEDAAQAIGARGVGLGWGAALSFFPSKNLGGFGDGGAILTHDTDLAARLRRLRNHGSSEKLRHEELGGNFRLDEIQAALLRVELPSLDGWTTARRRIAELYRQQLERLPIGLPSGDEGAVWNQFVVRVPADRRAAVRAHLAERGIESAVYYPLPLHLQPALAALGHRPGDFPRAERAAQESIALPIHPGLSEGAVSRVAGALSDCFR